MNSQPTDRIPVLTDIVEPDAAGSAPFIDDTQRFLEALEAHLTTAIHEQADELVHNACREMEALLLEQVSDRLDALLPGLIAKVIAEHFNAPARTN
jgi:FixJ family two-component response regulator